MRSAAVVWRHFTTRKMDVAVVVGKDDEAVLREARHQGYLRDSVTIAVSFFQDGARRSVHYERTDGGKFEETTK